MNVREALLQNIFGGAPWYLRLSGVLLLSLLGCATPVIRPQSADEPEKDRYEMKTIGDITTVGNAEPVPIAGVGLVEGLEGTGGEAAKDSYRELLEMELKKKGYKKVNELLTSRNFAMVIVTAQVPPGATQHEPLDVEVKLPPQTRATSLRGGYLRECTLFNYNSTANLNPGHVGPVSLMLGHPLATAEGVVLIGSGEKDDGQSEKQGRIYGGCKLKFDAAMALLLNQGEQFARRAALVADRINTTFHGSPSGIPGNDLAVAKNKIYVTLHVPAQYRYNLPRYLRVVRLIPLYSRGEPGAGDADRHGYRQRLADDLLDPARTVEAALRLEALGHDSIPTLKTALTSKHTLVRFCAAEALAYLGSASCGEELARAAEEPALRAFALTAMASLDEAVCQVKLQEMLVTAQADEQRYGAFHALQALNENNKEVEGEFLNDCFWLHHVSPGTQPLLHVTTASKPEIVVFGGEALLKAPFSLLAGDFTVTASEDDQAQCNISRIQLRQASRRKTSLKVIDIIHTMADMGCSYYEVVDIFRQADACQCLNCPLRFDAVPQAVSVYELAKAGKEGKLPSTDRDPEGIANVDLGMTPTLFATVKKPRPSPSRDEEALTRKREPPEKKAAQRLLPVDE
jgi:hypothetical protein